MAIAESFAGSNTISTTEYDLPSNSTTLSSQTADGIYQLFLNLTNMVAGDQYTLKIYEKTRSSESQALIDSIVFSGAQPEPLYASPALLFLHGWTFTLVKNQGSDRIFSWSIRQVA